MSKDQEVVTYYLLRTVSIYVYREDVTLVVIIS